MFGIGESVAGLRQDVRDLKEAIADLKLRKEGLTRSIELSDEIVRLKTEISNLQIERGKLKEDHGREDRELRHMIGLEKKRQEVEIAQAKKETALSVREENLAADKKRFEEQLKFHDDRFTKEVGYLKDILGDILKRLPTVTVNRTK